MRIAGSSLAHVFLVSATAHKKHAQNVDHHTVHTFVKIHIPIAMCDSKYKSTEPEQDNCSHSLWSQAQVRQLPSCQFEVHLLKSNDAPENDRDSTCQAT